MNPQIPPPSAEALAVSCQLQQHIRDIVTRQGKMPFSQFMQDALYTPGLGYYSNDGEKFGGGGDFVTAPTLSPLFGQTLARQLAAVLPQTEGNIYEFGAGSGNLAADLLDALSDGINCYYIIELSADLAERQRRHINSRVSPEAAAKVVHLTALPPTFDGIIIGNEVLDAMPVELVSRHDNRFWQICVDHDDNGFTQTERPLSDAGLLETAQNYFPDNEPYTSELHPAQNAFIRTLAERLTRGAIIMIDYGFDAGQYYHPQRHMGTLIGHYRHHVIHDPFFHIGLTDLTAHVNFTDIAQAGTDCGLDLIGYATQAHFLINLGITELLAQSGQPDSAAYLREAAAVQTLLNPHEMGELFKVIAFGRSIDVDWQGFVFGDICHKL